MDFITVFQDGSVLDFSKDDIGTINIKNLLECIGKERRYANVIDFTVLEHSIACGRATAVLYPDNTPLIQYAYFHDIHEAIIRDVPAPFKAIVGDAFYKAENEIQTKVLRKLGVDVSTDDKDLFKEIDVTVGFVESLRYHTMTKTEQMLESGDYNPVLVAVCTDAIISVENEFQEIFDDNGQIIDNILKIYREVLGLHHN